MTQVMMLMLAMFVSIGVLIVGLVFPYGTMFDLLHIMILVDLVLVLLATLLEFIQVLPVLLGRIQKVPISGLPLVNNILSRNCFQTGKNTLAP